MQIPVLIEPVAGNGYRARGGAPLAATADGATPSEALQKLREVIQARLATGSSLVPLEVADDENPWLAMGGMFKDDPLFDEWQQDIAEYRRKIEEDPEIP